METKPTIRIVEFDYDNGYGDVIPVKATVQLTEGEEPFIADLFAYDRHGNEPRFADLARIEEKAIELAGDAT